MTTEPRRSLGVEIFNMLLTLAIGGGIQTVAAPTVIVSCPARTAAAPDCALRWLIAFDLVPVRHAPLPALQSVDEVESVSGGSSASSSGGGRRGETAFTFYFRSAAGRTRAILMGNQQEVRAFRAPIAKYLNDEHAPPLDVTMRANTVPWGWFAYLVIGLGVLQAAMVLTRVVRGDRASSSGSAPSAG